MTPWVGIIGAAVGGSIGLIGQRMNIREQRKRDLRERVVDFLREADQLRALAVRCMDSARKDDSGHVQEYQFEMRTVLENVEHRKQYLDLTASWMLRYWVGQVFGAAVSLCGCTFERVKDGGAESVDATFEVATKSYKAMRSNLVSHLRPDIDDLPWWTRRPYLSAIDSVMHPRKLWRKNSDNVE